MDNEILILNLIPGGSNEFTQTTGLTLTANLTAGVGEPGAPGAPGAPGTTDYNALQNKPTIPTQYTDALAAAAAPVQSVSTRTGAVIVTKTDVGLSNVPNTDFTSAVAANTAKNSYPSGDATKLAGIASGAEVNVNADWSAASGDAQILNKPTIPSAYTLPTASTSTLGGVKVDGTTVTITGGVISSVGGGGTPAGSSGDIQYNNAGAFGGVTVLPVANGGTGSASQNYIGNTKLAAAATIYVAATGNDSNDGLTWDTAKATIASALTALGSTTPGTIRLGKNTTSTPYPVSAQALNWNQSIVGDDPVTCFISVNGTGNGLYWGGNAGLTGGYADNTAGHLRGFTIQPGSGTSSATTLVHIYDMVGADLTDVAINQSPGYGLWFEGVNKYVERISLIRCTLYQNAVNIRHTRQTGGTAGNSHGYHRHLDCRMNIGSGQIGIQVENDISLYAFVSNILCNVSGGVGNTAIFLNMLNTANIQGAVNWTAEQTSGTGATFLSVGATNAFNVTGFLRKATLVNSINSSATFSGIPSPQNSSQSGAVAIDVNSQGSAVDKPVIVAITCTGNITATTLTNLMAGQLLTLVYRQDGTGGRTIVPPTNVIWANNTAPIWSTAANLRDAITFYVAGTGGQSGQLQLIEISRSMGSAEAIPESRVTNLVSDLASKVPTSRTVNGYVLSSNVTLTQDDIASGITNKAYTATEQTKLSGIATGATANSSDATLENRANHTGTQSVSTITGLATVATSGAYTDLSGTPSAYSLPTATTSVLGGVKVDGTTVTITSGVISAVGSGSPAWGTVTGTLSSQTDLNNALTALLPLAGGTMTGNLTTPQLLLNSTAYLDGATAGQINPTGSFGSSSWYNGANMTLYNTTDQTTNYESLQMYWSGNQCYIQVGKGGTGSIRSLYFGISSRAIQFVDAASSSGFYRFNHGYTSSTATSVSIIGTFAGSTGTSAALSVSPSISRSGTGGYTALLINPTESSLGSGSNLLIDAQVGGTSKFKVDNTGKTTIAKLNIASIPTSATGLSTGDVWNSAGTLKIV